MYILVKNQTYVAKNKLQKAIQELLTSQNRRSFKDLEERKNHKTVMGVEIQALCVQHPRCNKVGLSTWNHEDHEKDETLSVFGLIEMVYYYGENLK